MSDGMPTPVAANIAPVVLAPPVILLVYEFWDVALTALDTHLKAYPNIWLVDNHSPTDRGDEVRHRFPHVRLIRTPFNGGWAYGYNLALATATAEGFRSAYLLNSDTAPAPGAIESALSALDATPRAAAVGSVVLSWDGETAEYDGRLYRAGKGPHPDTISPELMASTRVHGAAMAISLDAIRDVGPFHEEYFLYHEETEWLIRALAAGWSLWADGRSRVRHMAGGSMGGISKRYYLTRNRFLAYRRGISLSGDPASFWSILWEEAGHLYAPDPKERFGAKQGIVDGVLGRGGKRVDPISRAWIEIQVLPLRIAMKIRSLLLPTLTTSKTASADVFSTN